MNNSPKPLTETQIRRIKDQIDLNSATFLTPAELASLLTISGSSESYRFFKNGEGHVMGLPLAELSEEEICDDYEQKLRLILQMVRDGKLTLESRHGLKEPVFSILAFYRAFMRERRIFPRCLRGMVGRSLAGERRRKAERRTQSKNKAQIRRERRGSGSRSDKLEKRLRKIGFQFAKRFAEQVPGAGDAAKGKVGNEVRELSGYLFIKALQSEGQLRVDGKDLSPKTAKKHLKVIFGATASSPGTKGFYFKFKNGRTSPQAGEWPLYRRLVKQCAEALGFTGNFSGDSSQPIKVDPLAKHEFWSGQCSP